MVIVVADCKQECMHINGLISFPELYNEAAIEICDGKKRDVISSEIFFFLLSKKFLALSYFICLCINEFFVNIFIFIDPDNRYLCICI